MSVNRIKIATIDEKLKYDRIAGFSLNGIRETIPCGFTLDKPPGF